MPRSIEIRPAQYAEVVRVARRMREWDRREIHACRNDESAENLARDCVLASRFRWVALLEGEPVAAFGAVELRRGLWEVWLFATEAWPKVALAVTLFFRQVALPQVRAAGAQRAECRSLAGHTEAHRWLELLGARRECALRDYGRGRETYYLYAWRVSDLERRERRRKPRRRRRPRRTNA